MKVGRKNNSQKRVQSSSGEIVATSVRLKKDNYDYLRKVSFNENKSINLIINEIIGHDKDVPKGNIPAPSSTNN